jgi:protein pelota
MKLIKKEIREKDGFGMVVLRAEEPEDMWHVFNLLTLGDHVKTTTYRKVVKTTSGGTTSTKKRLNLTVEVESTDFDPDACVLRLRGKNVEMHDDVQLGSYHTLSLELNRNFTLTKDRWDAMFLERLDTCTDLTKSADVAAVVMEEGLANVCLVTAHMTVVKVKIESNIPRKREGRSGHGKALTSFYNRILDGLVQHVDFSIVKAVLLGSPGFTNEACLAHILTEAERRGLKEITSNRGMFTLVRAPHGHKHGLDEVLALPAVQRVLADTKAAGDVQTLQDFFTMMGHCPERAYYGYNHVCHANEVMAVDKLLITDALFRSNDVATRQKYVALVEAVRDNGGEVAVFSALHQSGEQLRLLSGIAALLRYPLADEEFDEVESESESSESEDEEAYAAGLVKELAELEEAGVLTGGGAAAAPAAASAPAPAPAPAAQTAGTEDARGVSAENIWGADSDDDGDYDQREEDARHLRLAMQRSIEDAKSMEVEEDCFAGGGGAGAGDDDDKAAAVMMADMGF